MLKLQAVELSKSYRGRRVVDNVALEIGQGEVVGLLGPNGAGKTTTFYIIVGLARPDSGRVILNGEEITDTTRLLNVIAQIKPGTDVKVHLLRKTKEMNLVVTIGKRPPPPKQAKSDEEGDQPQE